MKLGITDKISLADLLCLIENLTGIDLDKSDLTEEVIDKALALIQNNNFASQVKSQTTEAA